MVSAGFTKPSDEDERGWLWFVSILSIIYSVGFFGVRICGKYEFLWWDDLCLVVGYLVAFARSGLTMRAIRQGLGLDWNGTSAVSASTMSSISRLVFTSRILLQVCLYTAKVSLALFTRKIFSGHMMHERAIFVAYFVLLALSGIAAILLSFLQCRPTLLFVGEACQWNTTRWIIVSILEVLTEVLIMAVPAYFLSRIRMARADKCRAITLFAFRTGVIALSIALTARYLEAEPKTIDWSGALVLQDILLTYSFISATIPCVRSFLGAFFSPFLAFSAFPSEMEYSRAESIALHSISRKDEALRGSMALRADEPQHEIGIRHFQKRRADEGTSVASDDSERMMIRRHTEVLVQSD